MAWSRLSAHAPILPVKPGNQYNIGHDRGILTHTIKTCPFHHPIGTASLNYARRLLVQACCFTQKKWRFWSVESDSSTRKSVDRQVGVANFARKPSHKNYVVQVDIAYYQ